MKMFECKISVPGQDGHDGAPESELRRIDATFDNFKAFLVHAVYDLSPTGVFLQTSEELPVSTVVHLEIGLRRGSTLIRALGEVTAVTTATEGGYRRPGLDVLFSYLDPASARLIDSVKRLRSRPPEPEPSLERSEENWETEVDSLLSGGLPASNLAEPAADPPTAELLSPSASELEVADELDEPDEPDEPDELDEPDEPDELDELDEPDELDELDEPDEPPFEEPVLPEPPASMETGEDTGATSFQVSGAFAEADKSITGSPRRGIGLLLLVLFGVAGLVYLFYALRGDDGAWPTAAVVAPPPEPVTAPPPEPVTTPPPESVTASPPESVTAPPPEPATAPPEIAAPPPQEPGSAASPSSTAADIEAVKRTIQGWAAAWSRQQVDVYLNAYAPRYSPPGLSHQAWREQRRARILAPNQIQVDISDLAVEIVEPSRAVAVFRQLYVTESRRLAASKKMELTRQAEGWRIVKEGSQ